MIRAATEQYWIAPQRVHQRLAVTSMKHPRGNEKFIGSGSLTAEPKVEDRRA